MSNWTKESVQEAVNAAIERAGTDEAFRVLCKSDIHAAIKEVSGKEVPSDFKINVVDNTGYNISVILPALQKADGELGDSELESVAGGSKQPIGINPELIIPGPIIGGPIKFDPDPTSM